MENKGNKLNIRFILAVVIFFAATLLSFSVSASGFYGITYFMDFVSLLLILFVTLPMLALSGLGKDFIRAFRLVFTMDAPCSDMELERSLQGVSLFIRLLLLSGIFSFFCNLILILRMLDDPATLGPNLSVAILSVIYALFSVLFLLPIEARLKTMLRQRLQGTIAGSGC